MPEKYRPILAAPFRALAGADGQGAQGVCSAPFITTNRLRARHLVLDREVRGKNRGHAPSSRPPPEPTGPLLDGRETHGFPGDQVTFTWRTAASLDTEAAVPFKLSMNCPLLWAFPPDSWMVCPGRWAVPPGVRKAPPTGADRPPGGGAVRTTGRAFRPRGGPPPLSGRETRKPGADLPRRGAISWTQGGMPPPPGGTVRLLGRAARPDP